MTRPAIDQDGTPFRLGVIGHGMWPSTYLVPGAHRLSDVDLVAVCGRRRRRRAARRRLRVSRGEHMEELPSIEDGYQAQVVTDAVAQSLAARESVPVRR